MRNFYNSIIDFIFTYSSHILAVAVLIAFCLFVFAKVHTREITIRATDLLWYRYIDVDKFSVVHTRTLKNAMPADAYNIREYQSCSTSYHKIGDSGYWATDCDDMAEYDMNRWVYSHRIEASGTPQNERQYPDFIPSSVVELGAFKEAKRGETLYVEFKADFGKLIYSLNDYQVWRSYRREALYTVQVNHYNEPKWETLNGKES